MKIFITGGSGLVGFPMVKHFLDEGHAVRVLDLRKPEIEHKNLEFIKKSVMDKLSGDIKGADLVLHFAAVLGVNNSDNKPLETMRVNLEGSVNVFKSATEAGIKKMVYASSSEVYGEPRELPIREDSVKGPVSTYGVSKLAAEIYAKAYNQEFGTDIRIARFFNVYGPRQSDNFVIPIFIKAAMENQPIRVFGDGKQTRCFTYVDDIIDGVAKVVERGKASEAYNIGNNHPTTILELAHIIKDTTESRSEIIKAGFGKQTRLKEREIEYRIPDISKMNGLGWKPKTMIGEGIKKIIESRKNS